MYVTTCNKLGVQYPKSHKDVVNTVNVFKKSTCVSLHTFALLSLQ